MQQGNYVPILHNQRGFTLMMVLVMVVILGLTLGMTGSSWKTITQRAKEQELLWRGDQYRRAIESYYTKAHAGVAAAYPRTLEDLLKDPRSLQTLRHIRQLYKDPMTGEDFVIIKSPDGGISGVRSSSEEEPFQKDNFSEENEDFKEKTMYREWEFVYRSNKTDKTRPARSVLPVSGLIGNEQ